MNATAPATAMTTRERYLAGYPARTAEERAVYAEYGLRSTPACPRRGHHARLSGGLVLWHCPDGPNGHGVQAADIEREVRS